MGTRSGSGHEGVRLLESVLLTAINSLGFSQILRHVADRYHGKHRPNLVTFHDPHTLAVGAARAVPMAPRAPGLRGL